MALDLSQLQEILQNAERSATSEREVRKSLTRIESLVSNVNQEIQYIYQLLDGSAEPKQRKPRATKIAASNAEIDPEAPFGRKKDGSPKSKPGRSKEAEPAAE